MSMRPESATEKAARVLASVVRIVEPPVPGGGHLQEALAMSGGMQLQAIRVLGCFDIIQNIEHTLCVSIDPLVLGRQQ